jgi:hypothetical protein
LASRNLPFAQTAYFPVRQASPTCRKLSSGEGRVSASGAYVPVFSPPSAHEIEALALSAAYLRRAGNEAATRLLTAGGATSGKSDLIATLRDEMRDSAALCECLIAMFDDWGIAGRPAKTS